MAHTRDSTEQQHPINFADSRNHGRYGWGDPFGVWSCKFSADGNEVIAGGTEMVFGMRFTSFLGFIELSL